MLSLIWIICTLIIYGFEFGTIALIFLAITTGVGRRLLRRCIGL